MRLLENAENRYPVDRSRVYCVGYSFGGMNTGRLCLQFPQIFAAAGIAGMVNMIYFDAMELGEVNYPAFHLTEEMVGNSVKCVMPSCTFLGEDEMVSWTPLYRDLVLPEGQGTNQLEPEAWSKLRTYNLWRKVGGCEEVDVVSQPDFCARSADIVENKIGAAFESSEVRIYERRTYYIGNCVRPDGECYTRFILAAKSPHWPTNRMAQLVWEHISRFARNRDTGELILL